jgi:hypothetical protein
MFFKSYAESRFFLKKNMKAEGNQWGINKRREREKGRCDGWLV